MYIIKQYYLVGLAIFHAIIEKKYIKMLVMFTAESRIVLYNEGAVIIVGRPLNVSTYGV